MDTTASPISDHPPDWASIQHEVFCPLCSYNLRGLANPRCPECGYPFAWAEVLDPRREKHPFLFEHHPESRFRSFCRTLGATIGPSRFWSNVYPVQQVHPRRLLLYWLIVSVPYGLSVFLAALARKRLNLLAAIEDLFDGDSAAFWLLWMWPWFIFVSLLVFRWSMRKSKVSTGHVLRCVVYSHDLIFWVSVAPCALWACYIGLMMTATPWQYSRDAVELLMIGSFLATLCGHVVALYRLRQAYRLYMRFNLVGATLLAAVVISLLLVANSAAFF